MELIPNAFTVEEFAKQQGWSAEYVRQCCRKWKDPYNNDRVRQLPPGYKAINVSRRWLIVPTAPAQPIPAQEKPKRKQGNLAAARKLMLADFAGKSDREAGAILDRLMTMFTDAELADLLIQRWQRNVSIGNAADWTANHEALLTNVMQAPAALKEPAVLWRRIYEYARSARADVQLPLEIYKDGSTSLNGQKASDNVILAEALRKMQSVGTSLEDLYRYVWWSQVIIKQTFTGAEKVSADEMTRLVRSFYTSPEIQQHPQGAQFCARCLYCGLPRREGRAQKRTCDESCKSGLSKQIAKWSSTANDDILRDAIDSRINAIRDNLAVPLPDATSSGKTVNQRPTFRIV
jgi:hypothetical protein